MIDETPPLRPLLRLYGLVNGVVILLRHVPVNRVPLNWVIATCALVGTGFLVVDTLSKTAPPPTVTTIAAIATRADPPRRVTVTGMIEPEPLFIQPMKYGNRSFYGMTDGTALLLVTHTTPRAGEVTMTGRLAQMDPELRTLVLATAHQYRVPVEHRYVLDAARPPINQWDDVVDLAVMVGISALMILPAAYGYVAFAAAEPSRSPEPNTVLPLQVRATGKFRSPDGGAQVFIAVPAWLVTVEDTESPYMVQSAFPAPDSPERLPFLIHLTRGLVAEWGHDYTWGRARPAIFIHGPGVKVLLRLQDAQTAAGIAALLQRNLG